MSVGEAAPHARGMDVTTSESVATLVAATPPTRERTVDLVRAASLVVVVLGHWLMAVVRVEDGEVTLGNALADVPQLRYATWLFQVMPLFFVVGGFADLVSLDAAGRRGTSYASWLQGRMRRLLTPTVGLIAVGTATAGAMSALGVDASLTRTLAKVVAQPLWFLAVYLLVVALAPLMVRWHRSRTGGGLRAVLVLAVVAAAFDGARFGLGATGAAMANYVVVWLVAHQLGFFWADGSLVRQSRVRLFGLAVGAAVALVLLVAFGPYPVSMVGLAGEASNMSPPTLCLILLGVAQLGLVLLARPSLERRLARPRPWSVVVRANGMALTLFLWHLPALAVVAAVALVAGLDVGLTETGTTLWWVVRPAWIIGAALVLAAIVSVAGPLEWRSSVVRPPATRPASRLGAPFAAVCAAALLALLALWGLPVAR